MGFYMTGIFWEERPVRPVLRNMPIKITAPSCYPTPEKLNWNWLDIIFYQDPGWYHNWALTVCVSFIGTFGLMGIYMPYMVSKMYIALFAVGVAAFFCERHVLSEREQICCSEKKCGRRYLED